MGSTSLLAELDQPADPDEDKSAPKKKATDEQDEKKKPVRRPLPAYLDRIEKEIGLSDEEKAAMGDDWIFISYDTSESSILMKPGCRDSMRRTGRIRNQIPPALRVVFDFTVSTMKEYC